MTLTGTTRDGTRKEVQGCDFYTFRDGKVIRKDLTGKSWNSAAATTGGLDSRLAQVV